VAGTNAAAAGREAGARVRYGRQSGCSQRRQRRCTGTRYGDRADHDHAPSFAVWALMDIEAGHAQPERLDGFGWPGFGHARLIKGLACVCEFLVLGAVGENAVVADAHEALRQHVR